MTKILYSLVLICTLKVCVAQQDPMYTMYLFDKVIINPAFTGSSNWAVGTIKYRNQFLGIEGHPVTQTFNFHTPIQSKHIGVGIKIVNDKAAIMSTLNASVLLSYHLNFAGGKLSAGIDGGIYNRKVEYQKLVVSARGDNALASANQSSIVPDLSWGLYYQKKQCYAGISQYHLIKSKFNDKTNASSQSKLYSHFNFLFGNVFSLSKSWAWEPSMLLKIQPASPIQLDVNAMVYYNDRIGAGIQYRTGDAIAAILRINILENLRLTYSYDYTLSKLSPFSKGAHEIILSYGIKLPPPPVQKETHPRYYF
jgi:type IX secretion system PorP/SprF family membrane protein